MTTANLPTWDIRGRDRASAEINVIMGHVIAEHMRLRTNDQCDCYICRLDDAVTNYRAAKERDPEFIARQSIAKIESAAVEVSGALNRIAELEDQRALIKPRAIKRLMENGAATSATAAEKIVESDGEYASHRQLQRDAERDKWFALANYESAKLAAQLDVALAANAMRGVE